LPSSEHVGEVVAGPKVLKHLARDPVLEQLIARHGPARWGVHPPFHALVRAVVGQQLSNQVARTLFRRLKARTGLRPKVLASLSDEDYLALGLARAKGRTLREAALRWETIAPHLAGSDDEVRSRLTALKGVGPWTADMVLIFGLGREDVWPVEDLGLLRQVEAAFGVRGRAAAREIGERFRPYRSYAAHYLWAAHDVG